MRRFPILALLALLACNDRRSRCHEPVTTTTAVVCDDGLACAGRVVFVVIVDCVKGSP